MKSLVVNDASCLIDLRKGELLSVLGRLPFKLVVPLPVRSSEVLNFSNADWEELEELGMHTHDLTPNEIGRALNVKRQYPGLSANDCFCFVTASVYKGILLTGDAQLRRVATTNGVDVHGVLWVIDQLYVPCARIEAVLLNALEIWRADTTVFLPLDEVNSRLATISGTC